MSRILLASASATRAQLLKAAGVGFDIVASGVDETPMKAELLAAGADPARVAEGLAQAKTLAASRRHPSDVVIGADQTLECEGALYDKAASLAEARDHLAALRARPHLLHASVATARGGERLWGETVTARLTMRDFSDAFLDDYLARNGDIALWSVGAYALEGEGVQLFERIDGDYFAILGLPMLGLLAHLRDLELIAR